MRDQARSGVPRRDQTAVIFRDHATSGLHALCYCGRGGLGENGSGRGPDADRTRGTKKYRLEKTEPGWPEAKNDADADRTRTGRGRGRFSLAGRPAGLRPPSPSARPTGRPEMKTWERNLGGQNEKNEADADRTRTGRGRG
eukprot:gene7407-biopygen12051